MSTPSGESLQVKIFHTENFGVAHQQKYSWSNFIYLLFASSGMTRFSDKHFY
jgi:hypothetical protein